MHPFALTRFVALTLVVLAVTSAQAQKSADTLTQAELREHIRSFLLTPDAKTLLATLTPLVNVDVDRLTYTKGAGNRYLVKWVCVARKPLLTPDERKLVKTTAEALLVKAIDQHLVQGKKLLVGGVNRLDFDIEIIAPRAGPGPGAERPSALQRPRPERAPPVRSPGMDRPPRAQAAAGFVVSYRWCPYYPPYWGAPCNYSGVAIGGYWVPVYSSAAPVFSAGRVTSGVYAESLAAVRRERSPRTVARPSVKGKTAGEPLTYFWHGYGLYWQRDYQKALEFLDTALDLDREDARIWYYKGLSELALGNEAAAREAIDRGADLQHQKKPNALQIGSALERVQGPQRALIRAAVDRVSVGR
jgi:tetratricopeptide (TPR) repeat protein